MTGFLLITVADLVKTWRFMKNTAKQAAKKRGRCLETAPTFFTAFLISLFAKGASVLHIYHEKVKHIKRHATTGHYFTKVIAYETLFLDHSLLADSYNRINFLV